ncbi:DUF4352 domain-containing protein [Streptomyces gobiensis]|uniref:DUF4352 domain-containing protein n=1 Tax=Streptomyces gobiensis TaxID=2875706 RepID=UPI001E562744|nr:DUF4352 domain-containing protein [Streptomyces gobiensis]UGY91836.1 DUF4352 domain-containing protein [Streptomyces gobiensis]
MPALHIARKRTLAAATAAIAVLAIGGLAACSPEEPTKEKSSGDSTEKKEEGKGPDKDEKSGALAAGETASYKSGLKITISKATTYTPSEYAVGHTDGNKAYKVTVTLENTGEKNIDANLITTTARAGEEGVEAEQIYDDTVGSGFDGKVLPGKKATATLAYDAPASAKNLDLEVDLLDFTTEPAHWTLTL